MWRTSSSAGMRGTCMDIFSFSSQVCRLRCAGVCVRLEANEKISLERQQQRHPAQPSSQSTSSSSSFPPAVEKKIPSGRPSGRSPPPSLLLSRQEPLSALSHLRRPSSSAPARSSPSSSSLEFPLPPLSALSSSPSSCTLSSAAEALKPSSSSSSVSSRSPSTLSSLKENSEKSLLSSACTTAKAQSCPALSEKEDASSPSSCALNTSHVADCRQVSRTPPPAILLRGVFDLLVSVLSFRSFLYQPGAAVCLPLSREVWRERRGEERSRGGSV